MPHKNELSLIQIEPNNCKLCLRQTVEITWRFVPLTLIAETSWLHRASMISGTLLSN